VEDAVQEAVLCAYVALSQLREGERFASWLCGIVLSIVKTRLQRAATERRLRTCRLGRSAAQPQHVASESTGTL
jgi:DNA-directed RNA polymerase specialized sigma24 family protein